MTRIGSMFPEIWAHLFKKRATILYPFERLNVPKDLRGKPVFDEKKCSLKCKGACAMDCPAKAIVMEKIDETGSRPIFLLDRCTFCLLQRHRPNLVIASTHGWRWDRYLLREAVAHGVPTGAVIVGWDNPSSYGLRGAPVDWITCWSEIQKEELVLGSDWDPQRVNISASLPTMATSAKNG